MFHYSTKKIISLPFFKVAQVTDIIQSSGLNVYNLYQDCAHSSETSSRYSVDKRNLLRLLPKSNKV